MGSGSAPEHSSPNLGLKCLEEDGAPWARGMSSSAAGEREAAGLEATRPSPWAPGNESCLANSVAGFGMDVDEQKQWQEGSMVLSASLDGWRGEQDGREQSGMDRVTWGAG